MSYFEMNRRANLLARHLRSHGVGRGSVVALWLRRSPWVVIGALAAWKAQAAYLPLDPEHPNERLLFTVRDSGAKVVLTESALAERTTTRLPGMVLDRICDEVSRYDPDDLDLESTPQDLAYVIYTSGSTGTPKGVEITHANLSNLVAWHNRAFAVGATIAPAISPAWVSMPLSGRPGLSDNRRVAVPADYQTVIEPGKTARLDH